MRSSPTGVGAPAPVTRAARSNASAVPPLGPGAGPNRSQQRIGPWDQRRGGGDVAGGQQGVDHRMVEIATKSGPFEPLQSKGAALAQRRQMLVQCETEQVSGGTGDRVVQGGHGAVDGDPCGVGEAPATAPSLSPASSTARQ